MKKCTYCKKNKNEIDFENEKKTCNECRILLKLLRNGVLKKIKKEKKELVEKTHKPKKKPKKKRELPTSLWLKVD